MRKTRFLMLGGFLGAGKTTAMARAARAYLARGLSVGLVTNDQAYDLVDTESLRAQGFNVGEVPGACFCCKFDELTETLSQIAADTQPDVILAEPVGSCADLMATVVQPLCRLHGDRFEVGALAVLVKPEHGWKILSDRSGASGFSPKAAYIFVKQIEEADVVVINKIDKYTGDQRRELTRLVRERFPRKRVLAVSALEGNGFDQLIEAWDQPRGDRPSALSIDYDVYAAGEAELCWLNARAVVTAADVTFPVDDVVLKLVQGLCRRFECLPGAEPAHVKVLGLCADGWGMANLVSSGHPAELSCRANVRTRSLDLFVNARVATDPESLQDAVHGELRALAQADGLRFTVSAMDCFRPARPEPTHRDVAGCA